ncbi:hypothetical protein ACFWOL_32120 [Streptomyces sp. NPDC058442]|uniref:hypothetical protein n=1 Tax=Streptomyces sp. NPDC058442 TaxID=3346503 RepID=UPI003656E839
MTAVSETKLAWSPEGEEFTAFSGELVRALVEGVPDAPDPLEMGLLFQHVRRELLAKGRPVPQQRSRNGGLSIALTRNRWTAPAPTDHMNAQTGAEPLREVDIALAPGTSAEPAELVDLEPGQTGLATVETVLSSPIEETPSGNALEPTPSQPRGFRLGTAARISLVIAAFVITLGIVFVWSPLATSLDQVRPATSPCNLLGKDQAELIFEGKASEYKGAATKEGWVNECWWTNHATGTKNPYFLTMKLQTYSSPKSARIALRDMPLEINPTQMRYCDGGDDEPGWGPFDPRFGDEEVRVNGYTGNSGYGSCGEHLLAFYKGVNVVSVRYEFSVAYEFGSESIQDLQQDLQDKFRLAVMRADEVVKNLD